MTSNDAKQPSPRRLSEEDRAALFARTNVSSSIRGGSVIKRAPIPSTAVVFVAAVFAILGVGGAVLDHFYGGGGRAAPTSVTTSLPFKVTSGPQLSSSLKDFMGLRDIKSALASTFSLTDQSNAPWSLASARGKVVVLTFLNSACNDICPIEGSEIRRASTLLGANRSKVDFVIVNSDPKQLAYSSRPVALVDTRLLGMKTVQFLTGTLNQLNTVWVHYGLAVNVGQGGSQVEHNDLMYFISPSGRIAYLTVPFANESVARAFTLSKADVNRFSGGIVAATVSLLP